MITTQTGTIIVTGIPVPTITTPFDTIPNFGFTPTIVSVQSGLWSDPASWSPARVPALGDVVAVRHEITYDVIEADAIKVISIEGGGLLNFRTTGFTYLTVETIMVLAGGELRMGTEVTPIPFDPTSTHALGAEIVFANSPIDTVNDPQQWGHGLIVLGKVTMWGADKGPNYIRLASEPLTSQNPITLTLAEPATLWNDGEIVLLPDTRQLIGSERWANYVPQNEVCLITAISPDKLTLTVERVVSVNVVPGAGPDGSVGTNLTTAATLSFDHVGARNPDGSMFAFPHVANITRSIVLRSQIGTGVRGHIVFTYRAEVDVHNVTFHATGRTTKALISPTNLADRMAVNFSHLIGPVSTPASGYQYRFTGCAVFDNVFPSIIRWGLYLEDSHYGLIQNNIVFNWAGACMAINDDMGGATAFASSYNVIDGNFLLAAQGDGSPRDGTFPGLYGVGIWSHGWNNYYTNNVAAACHGNYPGIVAGTGYDLAGPSANKATTRIPKFKGADTTLSGTYDLINMQHVPILEFRDNESYGAMAQGMTDFNIGTDGYSISSTSQSVIKNLTAWHCYEGGYFAYPIFNFKFENFRVRGHTRCLTNVNNFGCGFSSGDYWCGNVTLQNADIQGMGYGIGVGSLNTPGTFLVKDSFLRNYDVNIRVDTIATPGTRAPKIERVVVIDNVSYQQYPTAPSLKTITMFYDTTHGGSNYVQCDQVFVHSYNGNVGDDFQLWYPQQDASFVVRKTTYYGPDGNLDGVGDWVDSQAVPVAGLTNQQAYTQYGTCNAGAVLPAGSTTRANIVGNLTAIPAKPYHLAFKTVPVKPAHGAQFTIVVEIRDPYGAVVSDTSSVTIRLLNDSSNHGTLNGTTTRAAVVGVATFTGLSVSLAGLQYVFSASAPGYASSVSVIMDAT